MTILILSNNLIRGGKERQIAEILKHLAKNTQNQYVLILRENKIEFPLSGIVNLRVLAPENRLSIFRFILFLKTIIKDTNPDIIHSWEGVVTLAAIFARRLSGVPFKLIDGSLQYARRFRFYTKMFWINKFNAVFSEAVAANSKAGLIAAGYREGGKYLVLPNGFDYAQFTRIVSNRALNATLRVAMVANFTAAKDFKTLVKACSRMLDDGFMIEVILAGDGKERYEVETLVPSKYRNSFYFPGSLSTEEVLITLDKTDIGILLSKKGHSEGMSNSIMEYMFSGIPVIATRTGGNSELIVDGHNGFLVPHEDEEMVVASLLKLLSDPCLRKEMGERSKQKAFQEFGIDEVAAKFIALYESLAT